MLIKWMNTYEIRDRLQFEAMEHVVDDIEVLVSM